jgi:hypothetical protein
MLSTGGWRASFRKIEPWMSDDEIDSDARWSEVIAESLDETNYGIVCITRSNQHATAASPSPAIS